MKWYLVYIDNTGGGFNGAVPGDGFLSHRRPLEFATAFTSLIEAERMARAYRRWVHLITGVVQVAPPRSFEITKSTGLAANAVASEYEFRLGFDSFIDPITEDEFNPGTFFTGTDAVRRAAARAFVDLGTLRVNVFDPTFAAPPRNHVLDVTIGSPFAGAMSAKVAAAEALITVTDET